MLAVTDVQLYLAIGIPTLAILIGILTNSLQLSSMNTRISSLESRTDSRFNSMENRMDGRFNNLDAKFDTLTGKVIDVDNRVTRIATKLGIN